MLFSCARKVWFRGCLLALLVVGPHVAQAQTCLTSEDMDAATRGSLEAVGRKFFDLTARGASGELQAASIPSVAANFAGIASAVKESEPNLAGSTGTVRPPYQLTLDGKDPVPRAEFLCGVFGKSGQTANSAVFVLPNLPPGEYAVVITESAGKVPFTVSFVLQKIGSDWKLGGFYAKPAQVAGHNGQWFWDRARDFKAKGKNRTAWLYYLQARDLFSPVPFMSTMMTDKIYDESQPLQPTDLPAAGNNVDLTGGGKTYRLNGIFAVGVGEDLDLVVKYESPSVLNTQQAYQDNVALIKALLAKFPELRDGFNAIIARATEPSGKDYGTLLAVKDVP